MNIDSKIYVAGHTGLVGSALIRKLLKNGYSNLLTCSHSELDLKRQKDVEDFFKKERPEYAVIAAARVGGIMANNTFPADFIYDNIMIATNIIHAAYKNNIKKLVNLGSSCIYPKYAPQPLKEEHLLTAELEPTNEAYAIAKIAAVKMCQFFNHQYSTNFISLMPTNLYGPEDNYDLNNSHVLPALIRKIYDANIKKKSVVELWGDGSPLREFLYSDDLADAIIFALKNIDAGKDNYLINVGSGDEITIKDLANLIAGKIGYTGTFTWDSGKPNGTPRKLLDSGKLFSLGWKPSMPLEKGIELSIKDFISNYPL